ncbi:hypothetical protein [Candidatus Vondammii sp. HM_W22]|uniref:hypothetical protein n=1 Tax=Candidatus Vondammii sp. HM_W22 TaxID=2687299 RepID=UPI001F13FA32|nr:hypothetical protein [Candidatus Vondammii sp. HM_W22]
MQLLHKPIKLDLLQRALELFQTEISPPVADDPGPDRVHARENHMMFDVPAIRETVFQPKKRLPVSSPGGFGTAADLIPHAPDNQSSTKTTLKSVVCNNARYGQSTTRPAIRAIEDRLRIAHESCGSRKDISPENIAARALLVYQPKNYIQGQFEEALSVARKENSAVELRLRGAKSLIILPEARMSIVNISDGLLRALTVRPMHQGIDYGIIRLAESEKSLVNEARVELISLETGNLDCSWACAERYRS